MTDTEIKDFLNKNGNTIVSQDCVIEILNTSPQIISEKYDSKTGIITLKTPENSFTFKLILRQL